MENASSALQDVTLKCLAEAVLPFRSAEYTAGFLEKLLGEGIAEPSDLLLTSQEALETKLSTHAAFNFIEMADTISLRCAVSTQTSTQQRKEKGSEKGSDRVDHAHDISMHDASARGRRRSRSPHGRGRGHRRRHSRPHRSGEDRLPRAPPQSKSKLWASVERGDEAAARQHLADGCDVEETYLGWTPLMKAAEEGHVEIMRLLLSKGVDLEAANKRGRTALSFAAAPSMKRPTPYAALRVLLEHNADMSRKDDAGLTAKQRAQKENRDQAVRIFEEFEKRRAEAH